MVEVNKTPTRRRKLVGTAQPTISSTSSLKRRRRDSSETESPANPAPGRVANPRHGMRLTTSPYFVGACTPSPRRVGPSSNIEVEIVEEEKRQRKRSRLIIRGDTPQESVSLPATPEELVQALRRIKPNLIQEAIRDDPWKIIVAATLLNRTRSKSAVPVFWELVKRWPTPTALAQAEASSLTELLRPLGIQSVRTSRLIKLSNAYVTQPPVQPPQTTETSDASARKSTRASPRQVYDQNSARPSPPPSGTLPLLNTQAHSTTDQESPLNPDKVSTSPPSPTPQSFQRTANSSAHAQSAKQYRVTQKSSAIAHLPFTGPYAIDSFRIFSSSLTGGGGPCRVEEQLDRIARLSRSEHRSPANDFDETPVWYDPGAFRMSGDDEAEWRQVKPEDKELRRYLVWRWAIEGVAYDPGKQTYRPADWSYLIQLIRQ